MKYHYFISYVGNISSINEGIGNGVIDLDKKITNIKDVLVIQNKIMEDIKWSNVVIISLHLLN
jgi:hypothetical protein